MSEDENVSSESHRSCTGKGLPLAKPVLIVNIQSEKKRRRNKFDLSEAIRNIDFKQIQKPLDPSTKVPIEPAHKLEITLEPDEFTEEKFISPTRPKSYVGAEQDLDTRCSLTIKRLFIKTRPRRYRRKVSSHSCVLD